MSKLVAIHQPNFFPWLGYFDKLARADVFIILDHVQFSKTKGNWGNRVSFLINRQPRFITMPVCRDYHGVRRFNEMLTSSQVDWRNDMLKTLCINYRRAPYFLEVISVIESLVSNPVDQLTDYNIAAIKTLAIAMQMDPNKIMLSSQLNVKSQATEMLIELVRSVGGDSYLNGGGSAGYLDPSNFVVGEMSLVHQSFQHPIYPQAGVDKFIPGLSCLDALFHVGFKTVASWFLPQASRSYYGAA